MKAFDVERSAPAETMAFGCYEVVPQRRELLAEGQPIRLGRRAFDMLMGLIEARGSVVSKDDLMARVWPGQIVEENNIEVQVSALRTAFGPSRHLIRTVFGRGYQFTGDIRPIAASPAHSVTGGWIAIQPQSILPRTNLPEQSCGLIGRDDALREVSHLAASHRFVTLTGFGGIGKTRLALAVARQLMPQFPDGVWLADCSSVADPGGTFATIAAALGVELPSAAISAQCIAQRIAGRQLLLVLDTCEHVIAPAAELAEALLRIAPGVRIIATSREPLNVEGEQIYQVRPLAVPPEHAEGDDDLLRHGAARLFLERAHAAQAYCSPDQSAAAIAAICRRLDGVPLAIELAAARVAALGVEEVAARIDDRFNLLTTGRRTALRRHQTLRAMLDWSYELLTEFERVILRRLGVFTGAFSLEAAVAVAGDARIVPGDVVKCLSNLVMKSLVEIKFEGTAHYRLLETTRAYALEKLGESEGCEQVARRDAEYNREFVARAEPELEIPPAVEWLADHGTRSVTLAQRRGRPSIGPGHSPWSLPEVQSYADHPGSRAPFSNTRSRKLGLRLVSTEQAA